jgi:hypothetical protein
MSFTGGSAAPDVSARVGDRLRGLKRLLADYATGTMHARTLVRREERRLEQLVWASHESGMRGKDIATVHSIGVRQVERIIRKWRRQLGVTIRR